MVVAASYLIEANFAVVDLEDGVAVLLALLDLLEDVLTLVGQLHSGHRHLDSIVVLIRRSSKKSGRINSINEGICLNFSAAESNSD